MWLAAFLLGISADCPPKKVKIVFILDGSGSVADVPEAWGNEVKLANEMLQSVSTIYREAELDLSTHIAWGAIKFAGVVEGIRDLGAYADDSASIPVTTPGLCVRDDTKYRADHYCTTEYEPVLQKAKSMLEAPGFEDFIPLIWFLTDGVPWDYEEYDPDTMVVTTNLTATSLQSFYAQKMGEMKIVCAYLSPEQIGLAEGALNLRQICDTRVLAASFSSPDYNHEEYIKKAKDMFEKEVRFEVFVCEPAFWVIAGIGALAAAGLGILGFTGKKVKKRYFSEEEGQEMVDVAAQRQSQSRRAPPTRIGSKKRVTMR